MRDKYSAIVVIAAAQFLFLGLPCPPLAWANPGANEDLAAKFEAEYPAAAARIEEAYKHVKITGTFVGHYPDPKGTGQECTDEQQFELLRSGDLYRGVSTITRTTDPRRQVGAVFARGGSARFSFAVDKASPEKEFAFDSFGPDADFDKTSRVAGRPAFAPYCLQELLLTDALKRTLRVVSVHVGALDGNEVLDVETRSARTSARTPSGHLYFQPKTYALCGYMLPLGSNTLQTRVSYFNDSGAVPRVSSVDYWQERTSGPGPRVGERRWDVKTFDFAEVGADEFSPAALGIKDFPVEDTPEVLDRGTVISGARQQVTPLNDASASGAADTPSTTGASKAPAPPDGSRDANLQTPDHPQTRMASVDTPAMRGFPIWASVVALCVVVGLLGLCWLALRKRERSP